MAQAFTSYIVENDEQLAQAIERLGKATNDFRIPFRLIAAHFRRGNKRIFSLKSPGQYPPLGGLNPSSASGFGTQTKRERAETLKEQQVGFSYPLLVRTGRTASSLTRASDPEAVNEIGKKSMALGTKVPYMIYHQSDEPRFKMPLRKLIFIDGGPLETSKSKGRREVWLNILNSYVLAKLAEVGE